MASPSSARLRRSTSHKCAFTPHAAMQASKVSPTVATKRSYSDSGISLDSTDLQSPDIMKGNIAKPTKVSITVSDKKRTVNGNEFTVTPCKPVLNFDDVSSIEDGEIEDELDMILDDISECNFHTKEVEFESLHSDDDACSSFQTSVEDNVADICDDRFEEMIVDNIAFWERDDIHLNVITSKCPTFLQAILEDTDACLQVLEENDEECSSNSPEFREIEDDLLSLHPSDSFCSSLERYMKGNMAEKSTFLRPRKPATFTQPAVTNESEQIAQTVKKPLQPEQVPASHSSIPTGTSPKAPKIIRTQSADQPVTKLPSPVLPRANTKINELITALPTTESEEPQPKMPTREYDRCLLLGRKPVQSHIFSLINQPSHMATRTVPPLAHLPSASGSPRDYTDRPNELARNICFYFSSCVRKKCSYIHELSVEMFDKMSPHNQKIFWNCLKSGRISNGHTLTKVMNKLSLVLVANGNRSLLLQMITDSLNLPILDHTKLVKNLIFSLKDIDVDGKTWNLDDLLLEVLETNDCFEKATSCIQVALVDIVLSIITDEPEFLCFWNVLSRIFDVVEHTIDGVVIDKIVNEGWKDYVSLDVLKVVLQKLSLLRNLPVETRKNMENLTNFMMKIERTTAICKTLTPTRNLRHSEEQSPKGRSATFEDKVRGLLMAHSDAEALGKLFYEYREPTHWEHSVNEIIKILKPLDGKQLLGYLQFLSVTITHCVTMIEIDDDLQTFLMTLVMNLAAFLKRGSTIDVARKLLVELLASFESSMDTYYDVPLYVPMPDKSRRDLFILSRLIQGKSFNFALRWLRTEKFQFQFTDTEVYTQFCRNIRHLFDGLYRMECRNECKDLLVWLVLDRKIDTAILQESKGWNVFDYFKHWVAAQIKVWQRNDGDIVADANDAIFHFYEHLPLPLLRNVLILLYDKVDKIGIACLEQLTDFCKQFYQQREDCLYFHKHLTLVEIQLLTHVYFYKMVLAKTPPVDVQVVCDDAPTVDAPPAGAITSTPWDLSAPINQRVGYVMRNLKLKPIQAFKDVIGQTDAKHILECVRRQLSSAVI